MADRPEDRLIVALDVPTRRDADAIVASLGDAVGFYKIGLELLFGGGLALAADLKSRGKRVFLDLKFHDIGHTVGRAVENAARLGVDFLTVHGQDRKTMEAAANAKGSSGVKILAVTVLTNLDQDDLIADGHGASLSDVVIARAKHAQDAGCDGVIASGREAAAIRRTVGSGLLIITPGIRMTSDAMGDQTRIITPAAAIRSGSDYLVVGRPITGAANPRDAADAVIRDIAAAVQGDEYECPKDT